MSETVPERSFSWGIAAVFDPTQRVARSAGRLTAKEAGPRMFPCLGIFLCLGAPRHPGTVSARLTSATALIVKEIIAASRGSACDDMMATTIRFRPSTNTYCP